MAVISNYVRSDEKLDIQCGKCNTIYKTPFHSFKSYWVRCPCNTKSIGEKRIEYYLKENNINYIEQKQFDNCRNKLPLRFDFYLPDYDLLIEFDGSFHFIAIDEFGGTKTLEDRQTSDIIKNIYCIENNKKLLRISYNNIKTLEKRIAEYLENENHRIIEFSSPHIYCEQIIKTNEKLIAKNKNDLILTFQKSI